MALGLAVRLGLALVVAAAGIVVLHQVVTAREAAAQKAAIEAPAPSPSALLQLGFPLTPVEGAVLLVARAEAVPSDIAPLLVVFTDGTIVVRRHAATPAGPLASPKPNRDGIGAALVVPRDCLQPGGAAARGALLEILGAWLPERPLPRERLRDLDLGLPRADLDRLCSWLP